MPEAPAEPDVALRVADLTRRYGDLVAVDRLSFTVHRGEVLGFLGPNGAGKTTTLKMLCGLLRPDSGSIEINGRRLRTGDRALLRAIGVSPQAIVLWETLTCLEQLEFAGRMYGVPRRSARRRAEELLAIFGLEDKSDELGRALSGGMQRRLNIALALVHEPEILFLDEPQAGLDPQSRILVREYIRSLAGRMTVVVTTHDMEEAEKLADRVCIIDHGRLLVLDTVAAIKDRLGEGDLFELEIGEDARAELLPLVAPLLQGRGTVSVQAHSLSFAAPDAAGLLAQVLQLVDRRGLHLRHVRLRPRTLEDVFIRLTGRALRE